jgi:glutathione S-transferase
MITLHHAPQSRSSRIIWLLEEVGAPYEIVLTDIPRMDGSGAPDPKNPHPDK